MVAVADEIVKLTFVLVGIGGSRLCVCPSLATGRGKITAFLVLDLKRGVEVAKGVERWLDLPVLAQESFREGFCFLG